MNFNALIILEKILKGRQKNKSRTACLNIPCCLFVYIFHLYIKSIWYFGKRYVILHGTAFLVYRDFIFLYIHSLILFVWDPRKICFLYKKIPYSFENKIAKKYVCLYYHKKLLLSNVLSFKWWLSWGSQHLVVIF